MTTGSDPEQPGALFETQAAASVTEYHVRWLPGGEIIEASESFAQAVGVPHESLQGASWVELVHDSDEARAQLMATVARVVRGSVAFAEARIGSAFAESHVLWVSVPWFDEHRDLRWVDSYGFDTTALRAATKAVASSHLLVSAVRAQERERITAQLRGSVLQLLVSALWQLGEEHSSEAVELVHVAVRQLRAVLLDLADPPDEPGAADRPHRVVDEALDVDVEDLFIPSWQVVSLYDENGLQRWASPQQQALFGPVDLDANPLAIAVRMPAEDRERMVWMLFATLSGLSPAPLRWRYAHPDGAPRQFVTRMHPIGHDGATWAVAATAAHPQDEVEHARLDERARLAAWLHDDVVQELTTLRWAADGPTADAIGEVLGRMRSEATRLRDPLEATTLSAALRAFMTTVRTPVALQASSSALDGLPRDVQAVVYRVVAEGLRNADRHARAELVTVCVALDDAALSVAVTDNGGGDAEEIRVRVRDGTHLGLRSLRDDVAALGGELHVEQHEHGVGLRAVLPAAGGAVQAV